MWDGRGCPAFDVDSSPDASGPEGKGEVAGDNVRGGDYQMAGRMALSELLVGKVHILRRGGRWIRCRWQGVRMNDVVPRREKDIR